jgi:hypothetical protein
VESAGTSQKRRRAESVVTKPVLPVAKRAATTVRTASWLLGRLENTPVRGGGASASVGRFGWGRGGSGGGRGGGGSDRAGRRGAPSGWHGGRHGRWPRGGRAWKK